MSRNLGVWTYEDCALVLIVLGFAIVVGLGVAGAGALLGRALSNAQRPA